MATLERRARMHAALGEPVRLRIVDHLALGDVSPGELGQMVNLPTNLLAHHLRVLDEAGLIRRVKSEGDGRRSYVTLVQDDPAVVALTGVAASSAGSLAGSTHRVVFVCTQNSARSQLAAAAWPRAGRVPAASAGTRPATRIHPRAVAVADRHGLTLGESRPKHVAEVLAGDDLLVAVCDKAFEDFPATSRPRLHWAVPDPARVDTEEAFEAAYAQIAVRIERLAAALDPGGTSSPV